MTNLKRDPVKYIRDRAKSGYVKEDCCHICGDVKDLDFHHLKTVSILVHNWMRKEGQKAEEVLTWRDQFIEEHREELYNLAVTLCHAHHQQLHSIYGKNPNLGTWKKQQRWVEKQREKAWASLET